MKVAICGLGSTGKSTLFNALTGKPGTTNQKQFEISEIKVPDSRIDELSALFNPKKTTYPTLSFIDTMGAITSKTRSGVNNELIEQLWEAELLTIVLGAYLPTFDDLRTQLQNFIEEMMFVDLIRLDTRLEKMVKEQKKNPLEIKALEKCKAHLDENLPLFTLELTAEEEQNITQYKFLSEKPTVALVNWDGDTTLTQESIQEQAVYDIPMLGLCGKVEQELTELSPEEQIEFLQDLGLNGSARERFIRVAYERMDLQTFLTVGEDEVRGWTIKKNTPAQKAAGKIHTDLERGFIRAEVMPYSDFMEYKSIAKMREAGKLQVQGKEYIVQDGDILNIRFNI